MSQPHVGGPALETVLMGFWNSSNRDLFGGSCRPPVIRVEDMADLGRWCAATRALSLSKCLVGHQPWIEVMEVLKHEMAHQYVTEVLGIVDEPPHGPAFRRVCAERGIDPRAVGTPAVGAARGVIDRVQKLMALATSPNQHEARAALAAAAHLMSKEAVDHVDLAGPEVAARHLGPVRLRFPRHEQILGGVLAGWFGVQCVWVYAHDVATGCNGRVLEVIGRPARVAVAEHVHVYLTRTAEELWRTHRRGRGASAGGTRVSFLAGVMLGFRDTLVRDLPSQGFGIVRSDDAVVHAWCDLRHPRLRLRSAATIRLTDAHVAGREAGGRIVVRDAVSESGGRRLLGRADPG